MKNKIINYFFDSNEEYEAYEKYIRLLNKAMIVSAIVTIIIKIAL